MKIPFTPLEIERYHTMSFAQWWREVLLLACHHDIRWLMGGKRDAREFWDEGMSPNEYVQELFSDQEGRS